MIASFQKPKVLQVLLFSETDQIQFARLIDMLKKGR